MRCHIYLQNTVNSSDFHPSPIKTLESKEKVFISTQKKKKIEKLILVANIFIFW